MTQIMPHPFVRILHEPMEPQVNFFATCMGVSALPDAALSAVKLLTHCGVKVIFKQDQTCCGQPAYNTGFVEEARRIARYNMELFSDNDYPIVVPSGSCAGMMSREYAELFADADADTKAQVAAFGARVLDLSQYLVEVLKVKLVDRGAPLKATFHVSCHSLRVQHCVPTQKALLQALANVEYVPLPFEEECCGFGGTFSVLEPELSAAMVQDKIRHIKETGVQVVIAADHGCILNISTALRKQGLDDIKVYSLYDFIWQRINAIPSRKEVRP